ncbi:MAG: hypothetical protein LBB81_10345 [Treponema sp.]|jgi:hypothetical protein|nr:hypothetical protein [Treponema sp.]
MKNVLIAFLLISLHTAAVNAINWPSENGILVRNFGWNDKGRPVLGMVFSGDTEVMTAEKGEVIFSRKTNDTASRLPSPFGSWAAVDQGDGLISIYSRFDDEVNFINQNAGLKQIEKSEKIAVSGISGWTRQKGFYFIVYDRRERRWINPAMIITPQREIRPAQINSISLQNEQGLDMGQGRPFTQGRYMVSVAASIPVTGQRDIRLAPQRIVCSINGAEAGSLNFEAVSARDGILMVYRNGLVPVKQVYSPFPAYQAAEVFLNRGQVNLEVIVQDIAGNSYSSVNRIIVN